jgi:prepilin-type N-terminal cleavage/methylation domain-containing protein
VKDEKGFTLIETLCVISLLLICAGVAGSLSHSVRRITANIQSRSVQQYRQLQIERIIREAVEGVTVPYWDRDERGLSLAREAIENALSGAGYKVSIELEALTDNMSRIRGVICRCRVDGREYEGRGLFGSVPLVRER